jgi:hypothetical protein
MRALVGIFLITLLAASCKKELEDQFQFSETEFVYNQKMTLEVDAPISIPINVPLPTPITVTETGQGQVTDPLVASVHDIKLKNMSITITEPNNVTWDFLKNLTVFISYENLPELELSHHYNAIDSITNVLYMTPEPGVVLDDYVRNSTFDLRMDIEVDRIPTASTLVLEADMNLNVKLINEPKP